MELFRALGALTEPPGPETPRLMEVLALGTVPSAAEYTELFTLQLYPYASVYVGPEGMLGGAGRDRIAGFWRAIGEPPPPEPDHLAVMLALYARLAELERREWDPTRRAARRRARAALCWEHLASWLPAYLQKLAVIAPPPYRAWGRLVDRALRREVRRLGPPARLPLHLRHAPPLPDPASADLDDILAVLLAPVRSGVILTRADLVRAAQELQLGLRVGERRLLLRALLAQEPEGMLAWLSQEIAWWAGCHAAGRGALGPLAEWWGRRVADAGRFVDALRETARVAQLTAPPPSGGA